MSFLAVAALILASCASRDLWPVERVDPDTAVHVTTMAEPWIYVLDDPRQPANASIYLNVTVVEANRTGTRSYWLNAVSWDTSSRKQGAGIPAAEGPVKVALGWPTKQMQLAPATEGRAAAGISEPAMSVPGKRLLEAWCPLSAAQVEELSAGAPTSISLVDQNGRDDSFVAWQVNEAAISGFLKATGAAQN